MCQKKGNPEKKTLQEHGIIFASMSQRESEFSESEGKEFGEILESEVTKKSSKTIRSSQTNTQDNGRRKLSVETGYTGQLAKQERK